MPRWGRGWALIWGCWRSRSGVGVFGVPGCVGEVREGFGMPKARAVPPSWPTPSACCWSTRRPPTRSACTALAQVSGGQAGCDPPKSLHSASFLLRQQRGKRSQFAACPAPATPTPCCQLEGVTFVPSAPPRSKTTLTPLRGSVLPLSRCLGRGRGGTPPNVRIPPLLGVLRVGQRVWGSPPPISLPPQPLTMTRATGPTRRRNWGSTSPT